MKVVAAGRTHVGRKREHNEDQLLVVDALSLYVVADGMGGHKAGDIASALAVKSIENFFAATAVEFDDPQPDGLANLKSARRLRASIEKANRDVHQISSHYPQHKGMGSTVVGFCVDKKEKLLHVAHVGDSRCYRLRDGHLEQLTRDHSLVNDIRALQNKGANVKLANLPKNVITRALGMKNSVEVDLRTEQIREGDVYILCSDGLTGMVPDEQIAEVFLIEDGVEGAADILIDMANEAGGTDNITVVIVKIDGALCSKCGAVMIEGSVFCGHCGQRALRRSWSVDGVADELLERDDVERPLVGGREDDQRGAVCSQRFGPPADAEAPAIARLQAWKREGGLRRGQVVAAALRKREEARRDHRADGVGAAVVLVGAATAVAKIARQRVEATRHEREPEHVAGRVVWGIGGVWGVESGARHVSGT